MLKNFRLSILIMSRLSILIMSQLFFMIPTFAAEGIIFSYDRPLQLYALLESIDTLVTNHQDIHVIYRTSSNAYKQAYDDVFKEFSTKLKLHAYLEGSHLDFKSATLNVLTNIESDYVYFAVDDMIVKDYVDLDFCIEALKEHDAYGFYLRMGTNCTHCNYPHLKPCSRPPFSCQLNQVCSWTFSEGQGDWHYPNTVDMTIYARKDLLADLSILNFNNPNSLESAWVWTSGKRLAQKGLCYKESRVINIPLNRVQNTYNNFSMGVTTAELLTAYNEGKKINIDDLFQIPNNSPHQSFNINLIERISE